MKKLFLILFVAVANGQIVNIPDANFKNRLLASAPPTTSTDTANRVAFDVNGVVIKVDTNNDNEIQVSEALQVYELEVSQSNISNLEGVASFTNLKTLSCITNNLTSLDVSMLPNLEFLYCSFNSISNLNINGLNLKKLRCGNNSLNSLSVNSNFLEELNCQTNFISNLSLNCINLKTLNCSSNSISTLNVNNLINLEVLECNSNNINNLNISNLIKLTQLNCFSNQITSLNLNNQVNLTHLFCFNNQISSLNVDNLLNLTALWCGNNLLTTLNVNNLKNLISLSCHSNPFNSLYIKNGNYDTLGSSSFPTLQFVCCDEIDLANVLSKVPATCSVSPYCTFVPGGNYNTIKGNVKLDINNNGCDSNDLSMQNIKVSLTYPAPTTATGDVTLSTFTNANGEYTFYTGVGTYTISNAINTTLFNIVSSTQTVTFTDSTTANTVVNDFCLTPNGNHKDVEVVLVPETPARPGFDAIYKLVYRNLGNIPTDITANLIFNDAVLDVVSVSTPTNASATGSLSWLLPNVLPFQSGAIMVTLKVNAPTATPPVNNGDVLNFTASATINGVDENPADNTFPFAQTVVGSYDPNDITCLEGKSLPPSEIGKFLHYAVNFENTGTYQAENVVVKQVIDATKFDVSSMQQQYSSHNGYTKITDNVIEFMFKNINLAAASGTPPVGGGHGTILYKMKTKSNLIDGEMVSKKAKIYFDYNFPIDTNNAETTFISLSNEIIIKDNSISVYPNPTQDVIKIKANSNILKIDLFDIQGRLLETNLDENSEATFDLSTRTKGIYFLKVITEKGSGVEKIVKN